MSKIVDITDQDFEEEVMNSDLPTEVDFWAPWCGPCKMVIPIYEKLSEEYHGRFKFCMINVDENKQTAMQYQIMSIPMQKFFYNGEVVDEILGAVPQQVIQSKVEEILKRFPADEKERLKVLLASWVKANKKHNDKFSKWMDKVDNIQSNPVYKSVLEATREMKKSSDLLSKALVELQKEQ